jgi:hypothetical protein
MLCNKFFPPPTCFDFSIVMNLPPLIDELYEPFNNIDPPHFYENYLKQWQTEWFRVIPPSTSEEELQLTILNRGEQTVLYFSLSNGDDSTPSTYIFSIMLPYPYDEPYEYNVYEKYTTPIPHEYSAIYLYETVRQLSLYREPINNKSLHHMYHILFRMRGRPSVHEYMLPSILYRNLKSEASRSDIVVRRPGGGGLGGKSATTCFVEPVYGPSHNPLKIHINGGGITRVIRIHMNREVEPDMDDTIATNVFIKVGNEQNVVYDVIAIVSGVSRLPTLTYDSIHSYLKRYKTSADLLGQLRSMRFSVIERDILWAVKVAQLFEPHSGKDRQVELAKEWHNKIYQEYSGLYGSVNQKEIKDDTTKTLKNIARDLREAMSL